MKGYLNNLALRTTNSGNLVGPRLPSLFEPQRVEAVAPVPSEAPLLDERSPLTEKDLPTTQPEDPVYADHEHETSVSINVSPPSSTRTPVRTDHVVKDRDDATETVEPGADSSTRYESPEEIQTTETFTNAPATRTAGRVLPRPAAEVVKTKPGSEHFVEQRVNSKSLGQQELLDGKLTQSTANAEQTPEQEAVERVVATSTAPTQREVLSKSMPVLEEESYTDQIETAGFPERLAAESAVETLDMARVESLEPLSRRHWRAKRREPLVTGEAEPTINVTIGRLEVRATTANTQPTRTARRAESPVMPLDEYLRKQRQGGER